eukprot:TRINITY_DN2369_c0_g1_i1.p1 TRINITY_DN2369_c0_g1~~TRINITY_DN2369_c0_g1_i1.p1  ORF type:complete len:265 (+),score=39.16 TRINITY_DN2369_c0_g1_i1:93-887(+)
MLVKFLTAIMGNLNTSISHTPQRVRSKTQQLKHNVSIVRLPSYVEIQAKTQKLSFPESWPYTEADFSRENEEPDEYFYVSPNLFRTLSPEATDLLEKYYQSYLYPNQRILDFMSSVRSFISVRHPKTKVHGLGMNDLELQANASLTSWEVRDVNEHPKLKQASNSMDLVLCTSGVAYLTDPMAVFREIQRVLRPGGYFICAFSEMCFSEKAIKKWNETNNEGRMELVANYFHFAGGFEEIKALVISTGGCFPLFVVQGRKSEVP